MAAAWPDVCSRPPCRGPGGKAQAREPPDSSCTPSALPGAPRFGSSSGSATTWCLPPGVSPLSKTPIRFAPATSRSRCIAARHTCSTARRAGRPPLPGGTRMCSIPKVPWIHARSFSRSSTARWEDERSSSAAGRCSRLGPQVIGPRARGAPWPCTVRGLLAPPRPRRASAGHRPIQSGPRALGEAPRLGPGRCRRPRSPAVALEGRRRWPWYWILTRAGLRLQRVPTSFGWPRTCVAACPSPKQYGPWIAGSAYPGQGKDL